MLPVQPFFPFLPFPPCLRAVCGFTAVVAVLRHLVSPEHKLWPIRCLQTIFWKYLFHTKELNAMY